MRGLIAGLVFLGTCISATGHRAWEDGRAVEADISQACCGLADAHWFRPSEITETETAWIVPGFPSEGNRIPKDPHVCGGFKEDSAEFLGRGCRERLNKHGSLYWFFWTDNPQGNASTIEHPTVYCIFKPVFS